MASEWEWRCHNIWFPLNNKKLLKQWIIAVRRANWQPSPYSRLCSDHFTSDCYQVRPNANVQLLKPNAVPTIFNFPKHIKDQDEQLRTSFVDENFESQSEVLEATESIILGQDYVGDIENSVQQEKVKRIHNEHTYAAESSEMIDTASLHDAPPAALLETNVQLRKEIKMLREFLWRREKKLNNLSEIMDNLHSGQILMCKDGDVFLLSEKSSIIS